MSSFKTFVW